METNQTLQSNSDKASQALSIAYTALVIALIALSLAGWMVYTFKFSEPKQPKSMEQKVDKFFDQQDKEMDKIFDQKEGQ